MTSYWRGEVFDIFDGGTWHPEWGPASPEGAAYLLDNPLPYTQTFYIQRAIPRATFMGYHGLEVVSSREAVHQKSLGEGFSYKVMSVQPILDPDKLRQDKPGQAHTRYYSLPSSLEWMPNLADRITEGTDNAFDKAVSIVEFLRRTGEYDTSASNQITSSGPLDTFLLDGEPGTSLGFATAPVMLARSSGLPSRLAVGYLPGKRDPLSGAYEVRDKDAHAWAEMFFQDHGWVPFDGTPRPDIPTADQAALGGQLAGLKYLFETSFGDDLLKAAAVAPSRLSGEVKDALSSPVSATLSAVAAAAFFVGLARLGVRLILHRPRRASKRCAYSRLSGGGRVEKLLRGKGIPGRKSGQTLREYAGTAAHSSTTTEQLAWFTEAAWEAAYNPRWGRTGFAMQKVQEAKAHLSLLKAVMG